MMARAGRVERMHPTQAQPRELYDWLVGHGEGVLRSSTSRPLAMHYRA